MTSPAPSALATSPPTDEQTRTLKSDADFAVFDHRGDIHSAGLGEVGIYHHDVRYLSRLTLTLDEARLLLLSSTIQADDLVFHVDLTNPDLERDGERWLPKDTIHVQRRTFLYDRTCRSRLVLRNYGERRIKINVGISFEADFVDIFEIRGVPRRRRGELSDPQVVSAQRVDLKSVGLDGVTRRTAISFQPVPDLLRQDVAIFELDLPPTENRELFVLIQFDPDQAPVSSYQEALASARDGKNTQGDAAVWASSERANAWFTRSAADMNLMVTRTEYGPYPYAGLPWFNTVFGRDGILASLMYLWVNPGIARGVLRYLAAHQAQHLNPEKDAEPGKILHEHREGEMAAVNEIPFRSYYGTVDATPLFVILAEAYFRRTADINLISRLWPNIQAALHWIDEYGDRDRDGFVEYERQSSRGIWSQGWKDSDDAISHHDGRLAQPPIALCEVQGYAYAARQAGARLATVLGDLETAEQLNRAAQELRDQFENSFWCDDIDTYALALDGHKKPCKVRASNAGHCLFAGIASKDRAKRVVRTLLSQESFSGWGVRTLADGEARFNPMSYHNGSVWPHDNAIIAHGLARYGYRRQVLKIMDGLFGLSDAHDLHRMPELFCGFTRRAGAPPTLYPVACSPQAWAAASVFFLLQAALGMEIDAPDHEVRFVDPVLPEWLPRLIIQNLHINQSTLDLSFERHPHDVGINIMRREGDPAVLVVKHGVS